MEGVTYWERCFRIIWGVQRGTPGRPGGAEGAPSPITGSALGGRRGGRGDKRSTGGGPPRR